MKTKAKKGSSSNKRNTNSDRAAARPAPEARFADRRDPALSDSGLAGAIQAGPASMAQRQRLEATFGSVLQRQDSDAAPLPNRTGLPDRLKSGIEGLSGLSLDDVRVHYNSTRPAQLQARAYAQGTEIHLAPGQERHLPHEAWHVIQQKQGRVKPTLEAGGTQINGDPALEQEADRMSRKGNQSAAPQAAGRQASFDSAPVRNPVVQGSFLGLGLGLLAGAGALAYGAYRYYRHRRRANTLEAIRNEQAGLPPVPVNYLVGANMDTPSLAVTNNPAAAPAARNYHIDINPLNPVGLDRTDASLMRTALIHERTHITADRAYTSNQNFSRLWLEHGNPNNPLFGAHQVTQWTRRDTRLNRLDGIVQGDGALTTRQRTEIRARIAYSRQMIEYDPVINELLAYTDEYGIRANSPTVKALVLLARENLARRAGADMIGNWPA